MAKSGKKPAKKTPAKKKTRVLKYWLARAMDAGVKSVRTRKRKDAFVAWKDDKQKFAKPVQVELEFENLFDLMVACGDGRQEKAEEKAE